MPRKLLLTFWLVVSSAHMEQLTALKPTNSVTIRQSGGICANQENGAFVENPSDCQLFYLCDQNGDAIIANCPPTMLFNPETKLCDAATNVVCGSNGNNTDNAGQYLNNIVTDAATFCTNLALQQGRDRIVYVGSSSSCSQYYICYYGQAILQECSTGLHWNADTGKCDVAANAQCTLTTVGQTQDSDNSIGSSGVIYPSNDLINCPSFGQHLFPHMGRCDFFIYCVKGHAILQQCPFYYHFDVVTKSCQWQRTAVCVRDLSLNVKK